MRMVNTRRASTLVGALVLTSAALVAADEPLVVSQTAPAESGDVQCSCGTCTNEVCCKAPTGFAPLDQKCAGDCQTKKWIAKNNGSCGSQPGCCP